MELEMEDQELSKRSIKKWTDEEVSNVYCLYFMIYQYFLGCCNG
jgi:hypothetical protein